MTYLTFYFVSLLSNTNLTFYIESLVLMHTDFQSVV